MRICTSCFFLPLTFSLLFSLPHSHPSLPPSTPPSLPPGLGIHGVVTYFVVDKMGGNFKLLVDQYILKLVPKPIMDQVEAKLK